MPIKNNYLSVQEFRLTDKSDLLSWIKIEFSKNNGLMGSNLSVLNSALNSEKLKEGTKGLTVLF